MNSCAGMLHNVGRKTIYTDKEILMRGSLDDTGFGSMGRRIYPQRNTLEWGNP